MKWSYKTVHFELKKEGLLGGAFLDETEIEQALNEFGSGGWELISVLEVQDGVIAFFKQPVEWQNMASRGGSAACFEQNERRRPVGEASGERVIEMMEETSVETSPFNPEASVEVSVEPKFSEYEPHRERVTPASRFEPDEWQTPAVGETLITAKKRTQIAVAEDDEHTRQTEIKVEGKGSSEDIPEKSIGAIRIE